MNTNLRIKNKLGEWATLWPISEYFYSLQYDGDKTTVTITKGQLEVLKKYSHSIQTTDDLGNVNIKDNGKLKLNEYGEYSVEYPRGLQDVPFDAYTNKLHQGESVVNIEKELPETFKFIHINDKDTKIIYTFTIDEKGNTDISWERDPRPGRINEWSVEEARDLISRGVWVVLPEEKKSYISSISCQINVDTSEAKKQLAETITLAERLEDAIKSLRKTLGAAYFSVNVEGIV